ncbi:MULTISPECIES: AAA family ATPase [Billgrantia]|uniref:AAA family ATPase n=1 Tax=Billgrantia aerodenitrificans TaxID=2733483 RepID=A0ABS9AV04_9GAMM|nr:AAA family ATPase [Halomonas desiderata]MCE8025715.1 AAA family ATPase [Halomonas aerodenitrificans]
MKIEVKKEYKSLRNFSSAALNDISIITGLNGAGKSHFLQAILNGSISVEGIEKNKIIFFNNSSFALTNEKAASSKTLEEEYTHLLRSFSQRKASAKKNVEALIDYEKIKNICHSCEKGFTELTREDISDNTLFENYMDVISSYKKSLSNLTIKIPEKYTHTSYGQSLLRLACKIPYSIHEVSDSEFKRLFIPYSFSNYLLPSELAKTFWDYYVKYDHNKYMEYLASKNVTSSEVKILNEEEFESLYGRKPWLLINEILEDFDSVCYRVNSPEGLSRDDSYKYSLISKNNAGLAIAHADLSSGERILMALVGLIYRMRLDNNLPDLILFDEVDASLHPSMIKTFLNVIIENLVSFGTKIIIVTHSPSMVALSPEGSVYVMSKGEEVKLEKKTKQSALSILTEGFATLDQGLKIFDELARAEVTIITEGYNTKFIKKACELLGCDGINVVAGIEHLSGKNQLKTLYEFLSKVPHDNKVLFVWDCDVEYQLIDSNNTYSYVLKRNKKNELIQKGIENMFDECLFDGFVKTISLSNGVIIREFDSSRKRDFETFLLNRNELEDFKNFEDLINKIELVKGVC